MIVDINMPQMAYNGLSENWLYRFCGDLFWERICSSMHVRSSELKSESGKRLYPTFVAILENFSAPISTVRENDRFEVCCDVSRYGSSFFHGHVKLTNNRITLDHEMLTAFVERIVPEKNELRKATPDPRYPCDATEFIEAPQILVNAKRIINLEIDEYNIAGHSFRLAEGKQLFEQAYEPSPYLDFNGAHLLYFASYPTISDNCERLFMNRSVRNEAAGDWAARSSTRARHVFYYANLNIGEIVTVRINQSVPADSVHLLHSSIIRQHDERLMAEIFTVKSLAESQHSDSA